MARCPAIIIAACGSRWFAQHHWVSRRGWRIHMAKSHLPWLHRLQFLNTHNAARDQRNQWPNLESRGWRLDPDPFRQQPSKQLRIHALNGYVLWESVRRKFIFQFDQWQVSICARTRRCPARRLCGLQVAGFRISGASTRTGQPTLVVPQFRQHACRFERRTFRSKFSSRNTSTFRQAEPLLINFSQCTSTAKAR